MLRTKRRLVGLVLLFAMLISCAQGVLVYGAANTVPGMKDGFLAIEAESLKTNQNYKVAKDANASGGSGLLATGDDRVDPAATDAGDIAFEFTPDKDGAYTFWWRCLSTASSSDSAFTGLEGQPFVKFALTVDPSYVWSKVYKTPDLKSGQKYTMKIRVREPGYIIDKMILTNSAMVPVGMDGKSGGTEAAATVTPAPVTSAAPSAAAGNKGTMTRGFLMMEAEELKTNGNYKVADDKNASGGKGLKAAADIRTTPEPADMGDISIEFTPDKDGSYSFWWRHLTAGDSVFIGFDQLKYTNTALTLGTEYVWTKVYTTPTLRNGEKHVLKIRTREPGYILDKIIITSMSAYIPSGMGEIPESVVTGVSPEDSIAAQTRLPSNAYPAPSLTPPPEHPRLLLKKADIPRIVANMEAEQNQSALAKHKAFLEVENDGVLKPPTDMSKANFDYVLGAQMTSWAFEYVIGGDAKYADKAITALKNMLQTVHIAGADAYRPAGGAIYYASIVYDWCYDKLTDKDKAYIINRCEELASNFETGYPPVKQGNVTGHGMENQIARDMLSFGIATFDERPDIYNLVGGRIFSKVLAARNFWYPSHSYFQGTGYTRSRYIWDIIMQQIYNQMSGIDIYSRDQQYALYELLYMRRPDGQLLRDGDDFNDSGINKGQYWSTYMEPAFYTANYYGDPYLKQEAMRQNGNLSSFSYGHYELSPVQFLIFNDPKLEGRPFTDLPLTKYFGSPAGRMIARTGWSDGFDSPDVVAQMKIKELYAANHDHLDAGHFQLYYKGILASDSGWYSVYNSDQDKNYDKRTVAHNTITVFDPSESFGDKVNDGGQKQAGGGKEPADFDIWTGGEYDCGKVLAQDLGPDPMTPEYSYLSGDITKAYSASKMQEFLRSFMFFHLDDKDHPAAMVVFDKVESKDAAFKKAWLLHGIQEPEINGSTTVFKRDTDGYNGKMVVNTLLPTADNTQIEKIGGPGKEFWVNGQNHPEEVATTAFAAGRIGTEAVGWRIEVSPKKPEKLDYFLNVIQVGDANSTVAPLPTEKFETDKLTGVKIADRVVMFGKNKDRLTGALSFTILGEGDLKYAVANLKEGTWSATAGGKTQDAIATAEGGMIYFTAPAGEVTLTYKGGNAVRPVMEKVIPQNEGITIRFDKQFMYTDTNPVLINDRTMVPMRAIFEKLGAQIAWDNATSTVTATKGNTTIKLTIDNPVAVKNGEELTLDVPPTLVGDRTMVPVRFVSEAMGAKVGWDQFAKIVDISPGSGVIVSDKPLTGTVAIASSKASAVYLETYANLSHDGDKTTLWSANGDGQWIEYTLAEESEITGAAIIWNKGNERQAKFEILVSADGTNYTQVFNGKASGSTTDYENFMFQEPVRAKYVKILCHGNSVSSWNAIVEIGFFKK